MSCKPIIFKPKFRKDKFNKKNDFFRELIDLWHKKGYIDIIYTNSEYCWLSKIGGVLLNDFDDNGGESEPLSDKCINVNSFSMPKHPASLYEYTQKMHILDDLNKSEFTNKTDENTFRQYTQYLDELSNAKFAKVNESHQLLDCYALGAIPVIDLDLLKHNDLIGEIDKHFILEEKLLSSYNRYDVLRQNGKELYINHTLSIFESIMKMSYTQVPLTIAVDCELLDDTIKVLSDKIIHKKIIVKTIGGEIKLPTLNMFSKDDAQILNDIFCEAKIDFYYTSPSNEKKPSVCKIIYSISDLTYTMKQVSLDDYFAVDIINPESPTPVIAPIINIITQYCNTSISGRQYEYDVCVLQNLNNPYVKMVYLLNEPHTTVPEHIKKHEKCTIIKTPEWLTYKTAFDFASNTIPHEICCLSNLDIFLDHNTNWSTINPAIQNTNIIFCQSRYEYDGKNTASKDPVLQKLGYCNAQDAWIFKASGLESIEDCDFKIGLSGCDNAIADRMYKAGFVLVNSPNVYKIMHYDVCRNKTGENTMDFHRQEDTMKSKNSHPETNGYRLLPDIDIFGDLKATAKLFNIKNIPSELLDLSNIEQYTISCNIFTKKLVINNK